MTISNATLFKQAHAMARATIQDGDDYRATFGACLKAVKDEAKQAVNLGFIQTIVIILAAILFTTTATATAEDAELPATKGAIVYANKDGQKVAFEVTTTSNGGFVAKELYNRKITIFKLSNNKVTSSNGYEYDAKASKAWLAMYNSEQTRLNK